MRSDMLATLRKWPVSIATVALVAGCGSETSVDAAAVVEQTPTPTRAVAAEASGAVPPAVRRLVQAFSDEVQEGYCSGEGFKATGTAAIGDRADFNGDGVNDYVLSPQGLACAFEGAPAFSVYGPLRLWGLALSQGSNHVLVTFEHAEGLDDAPAIRTVNGRPALILSHAGPGAYERPFWSFAWGWNGSAMAELEYYDENNRRVNRDGSQWRATVPQKTATASANFPALPKGYYAAGTSCARAASARAGIDGPTDLVFFDENALTWFDGGPDIEGFSALGGGRFRVHARSYGNGDDPKGHPADFVIRITGPSSFVAESGFIASDKPMAYTYCPTHTVPREVRGWFEG